MKPTTIIIIVCVVLATILTMQNTHSVALHVLFWQPEVPVILLIVIAVGIGLVAGYFAGSIVHIHKRKGDDF